MQVELFNRLNSSKKIFFIILICIFLFMLVLNFLTPYQLDDFAYMYSFKTNERITSIPQIVESMQSHRNTVNGRLVAHSLVSFILMMPKPVFNIINAIVFTLVVFLSYTICSHKTTTNNLFLLAFFAAIWYFEPGFGDANLWLDGSVNYLWSHLFCILFFLAFYNRYFSHNIIKHPVLQILFSISGFLIGAYSENMSFAVILLDLFFILLLVFQKKEKVEWYYYASIVLAIIGYIWMVSAPATLNMHGSSWRISALGNQFVLAVLKLKNALPLFVIYAIFLILCIRYKAPTELLFKSMILFIACLISNFVLIAASYYSERSAAGPILFLILSVGILLPFLWEQKTRLHLTCLLSAMLLVSIFEVFVGVKDIYTTNRKIQENKQTIYEMKSNGIFDISLPQIHSETKYCPLHYTQYLHETIPEEYPNLFLSWYYDLHSLLGYNPPNK